MLIPVRCFTCGKVVGNLYQKYQQLVTEEGMSKAEALDKLELDRYCCRRMILTHVELIDHLLMYDVHSRRHMHRQQNQ
ncbi:DNA-directed RNA polymerase, subunit N/Rpb10 [Kipferlia bialata]|uniref:DNA-directed RNA polymerases I, II, and III subunit RPABC5 n=1 Tax=Kipferlia bialata TaxID=797122 RepID=A0A9K3CUA7_9EUKA|nr:DNA-directed RNA polymerase, subunit N/Rpb10 [Kipferlia bialata]|eukprot:g3341.t1